MSVLGLDLGTKTLGVAYTRSMIIASPLKTIRHDNDLEFLVKEVLKLVEEYRVDTIVLGMPYHLNGDVGESAKRSIAFQKLLQKEGLNVILVDERLSTMEAEKDLIKMDVSRKKRKEVIDSLAATVILEEYIKKEKGNGR